MATVLAASDAVWNAASPIPARQTDGPRPAPSATSHDIVAGGWERAGYKPSGKSRPVAIVASAGIIAALSLAATSLHFHKHRHHHRNLTMIEMRDLKTPPPPHRRERHVKVATPPPIFAPTPQIEPLKLAPTIVTSDVRAPVQPVTSAAKGPPSPVVQAEPADAGPVDKGDLSSRMIDATPPSYPFECRRAHEQGTVKLAVIVGLDGRVSDVSVASSSGSYRLDRAALSAVRHWRWAPLVQNGEPVMVRGYVTIPFVLKT